MTKKIKAVQDSVGYAKPKNTRTVDVRSTPPTSRTDTQGRAKVALAERRRRYGR